MAFTTEIKGDATTYTPGPLEGQLAALKSVTVKISPDEPPLVTFQLDYTVDGGALFDKFHGIKQIFENLNAEPPAYIRAAGLVPFDAGPRSKIRDVISQSGLPRDMSEALMGQLQKAWAKTP